MKKKRLLIEDDEEEEEEQRSQRIGGSTQPISQQPDEDGDDVPSAKRPHREGAGKLGREREQSEPTAAELGLSESDEDGDGATAKPLPMAIAIETDARGYRKGSIIRVWLKDFVTYDAVEMFPGPRLNVITGPNGSGKSSIACALALGLGAKPSVLGRGKEAREFVKHGARCATIELELCGGPGGAPTTTVRRTIPVESGSACSFHVNGKPVTAKEVARVVSGQFRVQVDNLCQFLPQDKVSEFAALSPPQLLEETERAVGPPNMLQTHRELAKLKTEEKDAARKVEAQEAILKELVEANAKLQKEVDRFNERQRMVDRLKVLEARRHWMVFENARQEALALKDTSESEKARAEAARTKWKRVADEAAAARAAAQKFNDDNLRRKNACKELEAKRLEIRRKIAELDDEESQIGAELRSLRERASERESMIRVAEGELTKLREQLEGLPDLAEMKEKDEELQRRAQQLRVELTDARMVEDEIKARQRAVQQAISASQKKLHELHDEKQRRLYALERQEREVFNAYTWVQENKGRFAHEVFGPVILHLQVTDFASALETVAGKSYLYSFVTQCAADRETLISEVVEKQNIMIRVIFADPERPPAPSTFQLDERLKSLGVTARLDQVLKAPPPVVQLLCDHCNIQNILLGSEEIGKNLERLPTALYFTRTKQHKRVQSLYEDRLVSSLTSDLRESRLLSTVNIDESNRVEAELAESQKEFGRLQEELRRHYESNKEKTLESSSIRNHHEEYGRQKKAWETLARRVAEKERELGVLKQEEDVRAEEAEIRKRAAAVVVRRAEQVQKLGSVLVKLVEAQTEQTVPFLKQASSKAKADRLFEETRRAKTECDSAAAAVKRVTDAFEAAKREAAKLREIASREAPLTDELKQHIKEVPLTLEEVDREIGTMKTQIELNLYTNPRVIQEFQERQKEIAEKSQHLESDKASLDTRKRRIEELHESWLPPLKEIVSRISASFCSFMTDIRCTGSVALVESPTDYSKYAIEIKVSFRQGTELQRLTANVQSGGEKSVSTMLYITALQELTVCPFRLVDEINQGMDPKNERMIFKQVARVASRPGLPQTFLITPKLLPDLEYTEDMMIHCVFNGPWNLSHQDLPRTGPR